MCTLTIVPVAGGFSAMMNRDEQHTRAPALPPRDLSRGACSLRMPIDPDSGGTWIALNHAGVMLALLNFNPGNRPAARLAHADVSRGLVIPMIGFTADMGGALLRAQSLDVHRTAPFRLIVADRDTVAAITSPGSGAPLSVRFFDLHAPLLFTSSGLGDDLVEGPRRELMTRLFGRDAQGWSDSQADFHAHRWPARPEISVMMSRPDARTVSRTAVRIAGDELHMEYQAFEYASGGQA